MSKIQSSPGFSFRDKNVEIILIDLCWNCFYKFIPGIQESVLEAQRLFLFNKWIITLVSSGVWRS